MTKKERRKHKAFLQREAKREIKRAQETRERLEELERNKVALTPMRLTPHDNTPGLSNNELAKL